MYFNKTFIYIGNTILRYSYVIYKKKDNTNKRFNMREEQEVEKEDKDLLHEIKNGIDGIYYNRWKVTIEENTIEFEDTLAQDKKKSYKAKC